MSEFKIKSDFQPGGDQPKAIEQLTQGIENGLTSQVLLGVTGSGKTYTIANVIHVITSYSIHYTKLYEVTIRPSAYSRSPK